MITQVIGFPPNIDLEDEKEIITTVQNPDAFFTLNG
jgi:hypothetical protein